jgi:hypothetical protein
VSALNFVTFCVSSPSHLWCLIFLTDDILSSLTDNILSSDILSGDIMSSDIVTG